MKKLNVLIFVIIVFFTTNQLVSQTIVEKHGQLKIEGTKIKDECGRNTQLKGMSYFWHQWEGGEYWNSNTLKWLRDDWKVEIVRAAMGVRGSGGDYIDDPVGSANQVRAVVDGAIEHGIYVIIDFHAHPNYKEEAKTFFRQMSKEYGAYPNVIYEIWNEPIGEYNSHVSKWNEIKNYAREVIAEIRANDSNNIIIVGTPFYSQRVDTAADNPLTTDINNNPVGNVAYTIHSYAGAHRQSLRDKGNYAISKGLALFNTECGRVGTNYGPNNNIDVEEWNRWEEWMDDNDISYCKWSLSNKNEISSSLKRSASANGNWDYNNDLTAEGKWNRDHFRRVNTPPANCGDTGGVQDDIISVSAPGSVTSGTTVDVIVTYSASTNRDVQVAFQSVSAPNYTVYGETIVRVVEGSGTITVRVPIASNTPIATDEYQFQTFITTPDGGWPNSRDNIAKTDIDVTNASSGNFSTISIGAEGACGGEIIQLFLDDTKVDEWELTTDIKVYTYNNYLGSENIKVSFINDGNVGDCDKNIYLDWIKLCETIYQTEDHASRTGCGSSEWLFCNGNFDFGTLSCEKRLDISDHNTLSVYPNPVTEDKITIVGSKLYSISIFDISGKMVHSENDISNSKTITTDHLNNGLYILKMYDRTTNTIQTKRLVVDNQ
ncbi:cellulase family glycosylhydrolase [uncultured Aquimarina sp.]|uniref:cellulase family glycosylhydrolase n=1 Tax=uncultured Aquimarina sp. TaxID=575652 RepID=UPI0026331C2A|nr:cellulase family glycosylhydrolase [uncultured Aquimarina sp.]